MTNNNSKDKKKNKEQKDKEELKEKLKRCKEKRDEYLNGWQRTKADFLNFKKKEAEREKKIRENTEFSLLSKILEVFDNLERAENEIPEEEKDSSWIKGISQINEQFKDFLEDQGVQVIDPEEEEFDPNFHEAKQRVGSDEESGTIIEVIKKGYKKNGRLLRPAQVKVSK